MLLKNDNYLIFDICDKKIFFNKSEISKAQYHQDNQKYFHLSLYDKESHINRKSEISYPTETNQICIEKNKNEKILRFDYNYHINKILQELGIDHNL